MSIVRVLQVYAGMPREVAVPAGGTLRTGLLKSPVDGRVQVGMRAIEGDGCADLEVHGLEDQALCVYPAGHWSALRAATGADLRPGGFGENLSIDGTDESSVRIGSRWRWGEVLLEVTKPRAPCATLTRVHGLPQLAKIIARSGRTGWYLRVLEAGAASSAQPLVLVEEDPQAPTVGEAWRTTAGLDD